MTQPRTSGPQPLLGEWSAQLQTRSGLCLNVRPVSREDADQLTQFLARLSPADLRFRFLAAVSPVKGGVIEDLLEVDHTRTENFLAFDAEDGALAATAMVAARSDLSSAEVAIAVRSDYRNRGVGWAMLEYVSDYARQRRIKRLETIEYRDNEAAISLEREMGFLARRSSDDPNLIFLEKDLVKPDNRNGALS